MYGSTPRGFRMKGLRKNNDESFRRSKAEALRSEARKLEMENPFSERASKLYAEAARLERNKL